MEARYTNRDEEMKNKGYWFYRSEYPFGRADSYRNADGHHLFFLDGERKHGFL